MRLLGTVLVAVLLSMMASAEAAAPSFPDRDRRAVVDAADVIPDDVEAEMDAGIVAWNRATGRQLVVATVPSLQGHQIQDYGNRLFRHWGLGQAGVNDGAILLLAPNEREVRIEVGYGLEPVLTDALSGAIIRDSIRPALRAGDVPGALAAGAKRIMLATAPDSAEAAASQIAKAAPQQADPPFPLGFFLTIGAGLAGTAFLLWRSRRSRRVRHGRDERRYATVPRAEDRAKFGAARGGRPLGRDPEASAPFRTASNDPLAALQERAQSNDSYSGYSDSSSWDSSSSSSSSSSSDSGFDSGGGSSGGGGADSNY